MSERERERGVDRVTGFCLVFVFVEFVIVVSSSGNAMERRRTDSRESWRPGSLGVGCLFFTSSGGHIDK